MSALVSIIMPSYNTAPFIGAAIRSVVAQTYSNWELIIVDDCSSDNSLSIISDLKNIVSESKNIISDSKNIISDSKNVISDSKNVNSDSKNVISGLTGNPDSRIRLFVNEINRGAAYSRNLALRKAKGKYIAFLDSDDLWAPGKLEKQIAFMERNGYHFSYTEYEEIDEQSKPTGVKISGPAHIGKTGMFNYCWPGCLTVMYDREHIGNIQIADIKKNNDYAMWLKIIRKSDCHLLKENLAMYRLRSNSISRSSKLALIKWHYKLYREAEGMNPIASTWITVRNLFFGVWKKIRYVQRSVA